MVLGISVSDVLVESSSELADAGSVSVSTAPSLPAVILDVIGTWLRLFVPDSGSAVVPPLLGFGDGPMAPVFLGMSALLEPTSGPFWVLSGPPEATGGSLLVNKVATELCPEPSLANPEAAIEFPDILALLVPAMGAKVGTTAHVVTATGVVVNVIPL
jgi:hypothetical protein